MDYNGTITGALCCFDFRDSAVGILNQSNEPRGRLELRVNNDELLAIVEADPSLTTWELAAWVSQSTMGCIVGIAISNRAATYSIVLR